MKKLVSVFLVMILLCFSTVTVFSAETVSERQIIELTLYAEDISDVYGVYPDPGDVYIQYTDETFTKLEDAIDLVYEMFDNYYMDELVTQEMVENAYKTIDTAVNNLFVEINEVEFLIEFCKNETNNDNYYSNEIWTEFQSSINLASNALTENKSDSEITTAYWELRASYNSLCAYNQLVGDVNGDGIVNVSDATYLSKALVNRVTLNSSQKFVSAITSSISNIGINDATAIQKYIVGHTESGLSNSALNEVSNNIYSKDLTTNYIYYLAIFDRYFGV